LIYLQLALIYNFDGNRRNRLRIVISGALGKMGRMIAECARGESIGIAAGLDKEKRDDCGFPVYNDTSLLPVDVDCAVDFSSVEGFEKIAHYCLKNNIPLLSGTTGLQLGDKTFMKKLSEKIPVFYSANMSLAIGFVGKISSDAALLFPSADIEITELHHRHKIDAPSGTALMLAQKIRATKEFDDESLIFGREGKTGERPVDQIAIHSIRAGEIVGEHRILFASADEEIEIIHRARSRRLFALGAVVAIKWLVSKGAGLYNIEDIIASK
jgi:4-hydroxy-tetrahydrodipicolinate reductase